jgi:hypothetical protein
MLFGGQLIHHDGIFVLGLNTHIPTKEHGRSTIISMRQNLKNIELSYILLPSRQWWSVIPQKENNNNLLECYHTTLQQEHNIREHGSIADHIGYTIKREILPIAKYKKF